ncbi:LamG domain-containing protein [Oceanobacter kriegii]|uniref:LamG domain-containing protein n=1 Tax=Oceanobacter kriegii TaxID=64972 RepID=UPI00042450D8|nr:LamG domain-containing protein [Oceanobacter kriegii]
MIRTYLQWLAVACLMVVSPLATAGLVALYHLDNDAYTATTGEVIDSQSGMNGTARNGVTAGDGDRVLEGDPGTCRYASFNGSGGYIEVPHDERMSFREEFSIGVWVRPTAYNADLASILSKDTNYEFHLDRDGRVYWWWMFDAFTSNSVVPLNTWTHITITYTRGRQRIYLNGVLDQTRAYNGDLQTNTDVFQIGFDFINGREFRGDIDEVAMYNHEVSASEISALMELTHPCSTSNSSFTCSTVFSGAAASHTGGQISFGYNSYLDNNPTTTLEAGSVASNSSSVTPTCLTADCVASGSAAGGLEQPVFVSSASTQDLYVFPGDPGNYQLNATTDEYRDLTIRSAQNGRRYTLRIRDTFSAYSFRNVSIEFGGILYLPPGDFYFESLSMGRFSQIQLTGTGTTRLYVRNGITMGRDVYLNANGLGSFGDASQLIIYSYGNVTTDSAASISGLVYAENDASFGFGSTINGAVNAANVTLSGGSNDVQNYIRYDPDAAENADYSGICIGSCDFGSFSITQPAYALACSFSLGEVSIQAMCSDGSTVKDDYTGTFDLTSSENANSLFYDAASGGSQITSVTMSEADAGETTVYLFHQNENPDLQITATDRDSGIGSTAAAGTDVRTEGFALLTAPTDFVCGATTNMQLVAIGDDESGAACQQLTGFTGSKGMKAWFNANLYQPPAAASTTTVSTPLVLNGTAILDQARPDNNNFNLTFTDGVADINVAYANAAELQAIHLVHDDAPYSGTPDAGAVGIDELTLATSSIVARPEQIVLSVAAAAASCSSADASCSPFVSAGSGFDMTAQAQCTGGGIASDFIGTISLDSLLVAPADGDNAIVGTSSVAISSNGSVDFQQSVDNIGVYSLTADANYFGTALSTNTLANIGRFYPDYFDMPVSTLTQSCSGGFTYMDQYGIDVSYRLVARNSDGYIVTNYEGAFASATRYWEAEDSDDGIDLSSRIASNSSDAGTWSGGVQNRAESLTFSRASSPDGPYNNLSIALGINDNDGGLSILDGMDMNPATTGDCIASGACTSQQLGEVDVRYGVMRLESAFGPETETLQQQVNMVYWDSDGGLWRINTDDNCTVLTADSATLTASNWSGNLDSGDITASVAQQTTNGTGILQYSAPGVGNDGSVEFTYNVPDWLRGEWDDDGDYADTPTSIIQFGQYRGHDRIIYWRDPVR